MTASKTATTAKPTATTQTPVTAKRAAKPATRIAAKSTPAPATVKTQKTPKIKKVRDSFSMPENEYREIARIKAACKIAGLPVKKSEVLRAGLKALSKLNMAQTKRLLAELEKGPA
jgi:hypothetical protein